MGRHILGILAATIAAPYAVSLMIFLNVELTNVVTHGKSFDALEVLGFPVIGTMGLIIIGIPLFLVTSVLAFIFHVCECRRKWVPILAGMITGVCFTAVLVGPPDSAENWLEFLAVFALPGAICGWIYWRIAIGHTPIETTLA